MNSGELTRRMAAIDQALAAINRDSASPLGAAPPHSSAWPPQHSASLANIENELAQVRDTLQSLAPAESLAGLRGDVWALDRKIDAIAAGNPDSAALRLLEAALAELREVAARAASGEALIALAEEVQALGDKIDWLVDSDASSVGALASLDQRFQEFAAAVTAESASAGAAASGHLITIVQGLADRLDGIDFARDTTPAFEAMAARMDSLADRMETLSARLATLDDIERRLADLFDELALRPEAIAADQRVAEEIKLETALAETPLATQERGSTDPTLPGDHRPELGRIAQRTRTVPGAIERSAASKAALGFARPMAKSDSNADFIAAARRAAQAAAAAVVDPAASAASSACKDGKPGSSAMRAVAHKITRRRSVLLGLAILVIVGALHIAGNVLGPDDERPSEPKSPAAVAEPLSGSAKTDSMSATRAPGPTASAVSSFSDSLPPSLAAASPLADSPAPAAHSELGPSRESGAPSAADLNPESTGEFAAQPPSESGTTTAPQAPEAQTTPAVSPSTIASIKLPASAEVTGSVGRTTGLTLSSAKSEPDALIAAPLQAIGPALRMAALAGNPAAEYEVGLRYAEGQGVPRNLEEAARWFERAAAQDVALAQYRLGSLYEKGQGIKKDLEKARRLYQSASDKGNAKAMHNLAVLHAEGIDGKPNFKSAAAWFRKAAERGLADSQYNLGILHARGLGVEQNLAESYKWFALAAEQGDRDAGKKRDDVAVKLDQQALAAARLAVQTFAAEPQPDEATTVKGPAGGWEPAASAPPTPTRLKPARSAPLKIDAW